MKPSWPLPDIKNYKSMYRVINLMVLALLLTIALGGCVSRESESAQEQVALSDSLSKFYLEKGQQITSTTFATLSGHLLNTLESEGVDGAIRYCNLAAYPLVDSLSAVHNAEIRRTSFKVRNPENAPVGEERQMLEVYQDLVATGKPTPPIVKQTADTVMYYAPIFVNALCLQCHGTAGTTMRAEDYAVIRELYPEDQATGYTEGDLRGIWSIRFRDIE